MAILDLNEIEEKYDCSSAPRTEWKRRMKNAVEEAGNLLLYAHVCAKSIGDMDSASETEQLLDKVAKFDEELVNEV